MGHQVHNPQTQSHSAALQEVLNGGPRPNVDGGSGTHPTAVGCDYLISAVRNLTILVEILNYFANDPQALPWKLQFLADLAPIVPQEKKLLSITKKWLTVQAASGTNNLKLMHLVNPTKQVQMKCAWGKAKKPWEDMFVDCILGVNIKENERKLFSGISRDFVTLTNRTPQGISAEIERLLIINP